MLHLVLLLFAARWSEGASGNTTRSNLCAQNSRLDECLSQLEPILNENKVTGLPKSKEEVDTICSAFKTGMGCFDSYSAACLNPREKVVLDEHTYGARQTFRFLCDDKVFQKEYLQHKSCYRGVSSDWDSCSLSFVGLVREELARRNRSRHTRIIEMCCAKFGFLRCIFVSSRYKCDQQAAVFLHRIADALASARLYSAHSCIGVDEHVCSAEATAPLALTLAVLLLPLFLLFLTNL